MINRHHLFIWKISLYLWCLVQLNAQHTRYIPIDHSTQPVDTFTLSTKRQVSKQSMVSRFNTLFKTLHGEKEQRTFTGMRQYDGLTYDSVNHIFYGHLINKNVLATDAQVFAWHPYWMQEEYKHYPYGLISAICFFAYDLDPYTGSYNDANAIKHWLNTPMIDSAKMHNTKVLLTVTSYGKERNATFLDNKAAQTALADSLRVLLRFRAAQGIDLDFVDIPIEKRNLFVEFVRNLRSKLSDTAIISLHLPTHIDIESEAYDLSSLSTLVTTFVVQGYEHEKEPRRKGAIAPLYGRHKGQSSMVTAVEYCLGKGLKPKQMIIGLPLYGTLWNGQQAKDLPYEDIIAVFEKNHRPALQSWSESAYIKLGNHDTLWYESAASLQHKFLWAKQHGLGVGLWGLGYDGGRKEIWEAVAAQYAVPPISMIHPTVVDQGVAYSLVYKLQQHRKQIGLGLLIIFGFFVFGIALSLLDWRVREIFFRSYLTAALLTALVIIILASFLYCMSSSAYALERMVLPFFIGALGGGALIYSIMHWYVSYRKKMP